MIRFVTHMSLSVLILWLYPALSLRFWSPPSSYHLMYDVDNVTNLACHERQSYLNGEFDLPPQFYDRASQTIMCRVFDKDICHLDRTTNIEPPVFAHKFAWDVATGRQSCLFDTTILSGDIKFVKEYFEKFPAGMSNIPAGMGSDISTYSAHIEMLTNVCKRMQYDLKKPCKQFGSSENIYFSKKNNKFICPVVLAQNEDGEICRHLILSLEKSLGNCNFAENIMRLMF